MALKKWQFGTAMGEQIEAQNDNLTEIDTKITEIDANITEIDTNITEQNDNLTAIDANLTDINANLTVKKYPATLHTGVTARSGYVAEIQTFGKVALVRGKVNLSPEVNKVGETLMNFAGIQNFSNQNDFVCHTNGGAMTLYIANSSTLGTRVLVRTAAPTTPAGFYIDLSPIIFLTQ